MSTIISMERINSKPLLRARKSSGVGAPGPLHSRRLGGVLFMANISEDWLAMTPWRTL